MPISESMIELLPIREHRVVDPFNRLGCNVDPFLAVIEFCQIEGPKPLATVYLTSEASCTVDVDNLAVWLMSCETASGTVLLIYNQQMGVYALSYYTLVYDIKARAFQRPMCVALVSSEKPSGSLFTQFSSSIRRLLTPFIICNRRYFNRQLTDIISISDSIENEAVASYYSLDPDEIKSTLNNYRMMNIAEQARKLRPRLQNMSELLNDINHMEGECGGHIAEDAQVVKEMFLSFRIATTLPPVKEIAPCAYDMFIASLHPTLVLLCERQIRKGVLYSAGQPILRFPKYESPMKERTTKSAEREAAKGEETLKTVTQHLDNLLYPVLSDDSMMICGSDQRKSTVIDIVDKLNCIKPKAHSNHDVILWRTDQSTDMKGVFGVCTRCPTGEECAILDTNSSRLRVIPYHGRLLAPLHVRRRFPSDSCLLSYISAHLTSICCLVYTARLIAPSLLKVESLSLDDERILAALLSEVDFVRYQNLRSAVERKRQSNLIYKSIQL